MRSGRKPRPRTTRVLRNTGCQANVSSCNRTKHQGGLALPQEFRFNFGPLQEGDWATFSAVSDTRCSTYLIFTAVLTAGCTALVPLSGQQNLKAAGR